METGGGIGLVKDSEVRPKINLSPKIQCEPVTH